MNKTYLGIGAVCIIIAGGAWWYASQKLPAKPAVQASSQNLGTYQYECDEHVSFRMTPASDMSSIKIAPLSGAAYPAASTLMKMQSDSGARYQGNGILFVGKGETVTLGEGDSAINCSPVPNGDQAPFNFGD